MSNVLEQILADKRREVEMAKSIRSQSDLEATDGYRLPRRNFYGAVSAPRRSGPNLIAEIKKASPSAGVIRPNFDVAHLAREYEAAGAAALSVLTDVKYFQGEPQFIETAKAAAGLPVLRKDFVVDEYQVHEGRALGADAILLIAEALPVRQLAAFAALASRLELCILVEVHSAESLHDVFRAIRLDQHVGGLLIGINNRDLRSQTIDLATTERLAALVPPGVPIVAESGLRTRGDVQRMQAAGARALLIGETFMRQADVRAAVRDMLGPPV